MRPCRWRRRSACRSSRRIRCSSSSRDFEAHEARVCVAEGETLANPRRVKRFNPAQCFQTQAQMAARFADLPSALANSVQIAKRCNLTLTLGQPQLPAFPIPLLDGEQLAPRPTSASCRAADLEAASGKLYPTRRKGDRERPRYAERLAFEIETILKMGFPGYSDRRRLHRLGARQRLPGRTRPRLGAGSLVAYALGITDLTRCATKLLFERFLNPTASRCRTSTSTSARPTATA